MQGIETVRCALFKAVTGNDIRQCNDLKPNSLVTTALRLVPMMHYFRVPPPLDLARRSANHAYAGCSSTCAVPQRCALLLFDGHCCSSSPAAAVRDKSSAQFCCFKLPAVLALLRQSLHLRTSSSRLLNAHPTMQFYCQSSNCRRCSSRRIHARVNHLVAAKTTVWKHLRAPPFPCIVLHQTLGL